MANLRYGCAFLFYTTFKDNSKGIKLLKNQGLYSVIVANKWMRANYGGPLRRWLRSKAIEEVIDFGDLPVFKGVTTYPCILRVCNTMSSDEFEVVQIKSLENLNLDEVVANEKYSVNLLDLDDTGWSLTNVATAKLLKKITLAGIPLHQYVGGNIFRGILTGFNDAFIIDAKTKERLLLDDPKCSEIIKPYLAGRDIKRYDRPQTDRYIIFTRRGIDIKKYPAVEKHLSAFKTQLTPKPSNFKGSEWKGRKPGSYKWYEIQDSVEYYLNFEKPKIIAPAIVKSASYAYDTNGIYSNDKTCIIPTEDLYLLALLNSKICDFFLHSIASTKQGGYFEYKPMYIGQLPIFIVDGSNNREVELQKSIRKWVSEILDIKSIILKLTLEAEIQRLEIRCYSLERQIDEAVNMLYGLTEEEKDIVVNGI